MNGNENDVCMIDGLELKGLGVADNWLSDHQRFLSSDYVLIFFLFVGLLVPYFLFVS